jgi:N-acylneuraminate cytidylyltransferase
MSEKRIAIIPARGGSKRIPGKNIRPFHGKPVIAWSIEAALKCGLFSDVMVSTDDEEIAEVAKSFGADVPFLRSEKNSDDFATTSDVLREVLNQYAETGHLFDTACCIYATAPFVSAHKLTEAHDLFQSKKFDAVFPVMKYAFPIQRSFRMHPDGRVEMFYPEHLNTRSQDLPPAFHDAGQFYFFRVKEFLVTGKIFGENSGSIQLSEIEGQDIDTEEDWKLAELKWKLMNCLH